MIAGCESHAMPSTSGALMRLGLTLVQHAQLLQPGGHGDFGASSGQQAEAAWTA